MKALLSVYKVGDNGNWWTYSVTIDDVSVKSRDIKYRMYTKQKTAIRHGQNLMDAAIYFYIKNSNKGI